MDLSRFVVLAICLTGLVCAKPVSVDEIFTQNKKLKLLTTLTYNNIKQSTQYTPILIQAQNVATGTTPTQVLSSYEKSNRDYLNLALNVRYGIFSRIEAFSSISGFYQHTIAESNASFATRNSANMSAWSLGLLIEAKKEGKYPAILLGASTNIMDKTYFSSDISQWQYFKGYSFFATSFYSTDPLVFLLRVSYQYNPIKSYKDIKINNSNIFVLSPMIYFAVNPFVSLNFGVQYYYETKSLVNGAVISPQGSSVGYTFGVAYELKSKLIIFADVSSLNHYAYDNNAISISFSYSI